MVKKILYFLMVLMFLGTLTYGIYVKSNQKKIISIDYQLENFDYTLNYIFGMTDNNEKHINRMENELNSADVILKVRFLGGNELIFNELSQKVEVLEVFKGDINLLNRQITIISPFHLLIVEDKQILGSFNNFMKKDHEYLVFADQLPDFINEGNTIFVSKSEKVNLSYFDYQTITNIPTEEFDAPYKLVKDNEFFTTSKGEPYLLELKARLLEKYQ